MVMFSPWESKKNSDVVGVRNYEVAVTHHLGADCNVLCCYRTLGNVELSRTWLRLEIGMQDEFTVLGCITVPSRGRKSLNIWEQL